MKSWLRPANLVLVAQVLLVGVFLGRTGRLQAVRVPDTPLYTEFAWESLAGVLGDIRAPGYPAFLVLVTPGGDLSFVPTAHYVAFALAVLIFAAGFKHLGIGDWPRMWVASALLYSNILHGYVATVASDTLAAAFAVASVGLLFAALRSFRFLIPLGLCVMATWLIRPAYLSLVVLLPLLGVAILMSGCGERPSARRLARTAGVLMLATVLPLLAYCTLRGAIVGRFGVVASGGFNLLGIAGQFLDEPLVNSLSEDLRPLAKSALSRLSLQPEDDPALMSDAPVLNYQRIENRYDYTIWDIFYPAAEQAGAREVSSINTRLRRLAQEIIRQRPAMYAVYFAKAFRRAVFKIVGDSVLNPYCLLLCMLIAIVVVVRILIPARGREGRIPESAPAADPGAAAGPTRRAGRRFEATSHTRHALNVEFDVLSVMTLTALSYAALQMAVVILVCPPMGRMTDAMALFVPALLMAVLIDRTSPWDGRQAAQRAAGTGRP